MEGFALRQFTYRYNKIMLYSFILVLIVSGVLIYFQTIIKQEYENKQLIEQFKTEVIAIEHAISNVLTLLNLLQTHADAFFNDPRIAPSLFFNGLNYTENEFNLDIIPFPYLKNDAGNLTGKGNLSNISLYIKDEIEMALSLNSVFKSTMESIPNSAWVYYISKNHFINIYPWVHSSEFKFESMLYEKDFYRLGTAEVNPEQRIFWTPIYLDEAGKGVMVTAAKPIYRQNEFIGTLAIDFTLQELVAMVKQFRVDKGELLIINAKDQLLAHPTLSLDQQSMFNDALPENTVIDTHVLKCNEMTVITFEKNHQYVCYKMNNAPWKVIYIENKLNGFNLIFSSTGTLFILLLTVLAGMLVVVKKITFNEFIYPAEVLVNHISDQGISYPQASFRMPETWTPWFSKVSDMFEQNRSLIKEVKQKNNELMDLNISLERYMPKFLLVLSFDNDERGICMSSFFANAFAEKKSDKKTVVMEYPQNSALHDIFGFKEQDTIFKHQNGFEIWNGSVQAPQGIEASMLMTKVLEQYGNIVMHSSIKGDIDYFIDTCLEPFFRYLKAIVLIVPDNNEIQEKVLSVTNKIKMCIRQDQTHFYTLMPSRLRLETAILHHDFDLPELPDISLIRTGFDVDLAIKSVIDNIVDRIERVHQISLYIPTTIDVNDYVDTSHYVDKAMAFLGQKFGGATSSVARGVWNSEQCGIVNEGVHIVFSYTTEEDLNRFANDVIEFIKTIKNELHQEAMAIEINKKMILV